MTTLANISRTLRVMAAIRKGGHILSEEALVAEWTAVDRLKQRSEGGLLSVTRSFFDDQEKEIISRLNRIDLFTPGPEWTKDPLLVSRIFDEAEWREEVARRFGPAVLQVIAEGFETGLSRISVEGVDFTSDSPGVTVTARTIVDKTKDINTTTAQDLTKLVQDALTEGVDMREITRRIEQRFDQYSGARAEMIAQTAGTGAFEGGQQEAFEEADVEVKGWLTQRDGRVRRGKFNHANADGQQVGVRDSFQVSGEMLKYPGDPSGSAGNVIRCRCTSLPGFGGARNSQDQTSTQENGN